MERRRVPRQSKKERLETRLSSESKTLLKRAAEIKGVPLSDFVVFSALEAAEQTVLASDLMRLSQRDMSVFLSAIGNPPAIKKSSLTRFRRAPKVRDTRP